MDLWVATVDDEYAGLAQRASDGLHVSDRYSRPVGVVATWPEASALLHPAAAPRPLPCTAPGRAAAHHTASSRRARAHNRPRPEGRGERGRARDRAPRTREDIMATGTVKWFNAEKGYGFIAPSDGSADVFAHYSAIATSGFRTLEENQQVEFDVASGPKGPQAENIRPL